MLLAFGYLNVLLYFSNLYNHVAILYENINPAIYSLNMIIAFVYTFYFEIAFYLNIQDAVYLRILKRCMKDARIQTGNPRKPL